ncbi:acyl-CoA thioester hydrolase [Sphingomonas sp. PP-F2F-A104-K0414]|uniref:acyl-CoA thioesterase n=1 Tax=Sphingomonas sp. PP-F2F-A104-K0414 TaxID=2135661 RepID=UPI00104F282D|nr:thioesterase family protein [Sphingomonas sp. PP-F2F-A104-K0414]TCP99141.1 acyl-CoA thioester hydrolase [Sphingomonas sp. PP-F2F-A104-K0414]
MRPGFAFSTRFRVRYAEIDGQRIVFNSRYLEYADVAVTEFWEWTGIAETLPDVWPTTEFNVRRTEIDYLKPFRLGDTIEAFVRIEKLGTTSLTKRFELAHAETGELHTVINMVSVQVDLETGRPVALPDAIRTVLETLPS